MSSSVSRIKDQLSVARSRLSQVVSTDSLKGAVKTAINQKVSNYQIPLLDNYDNALDSIVKRYDGMITLFKETVGETNDSAIINTEYLERIKERMKDPIEGLAQISARTQSIYADISDIISLPNPSLNDVNTTYANAQKSLDETIENMGVFNQTVADSGISDLLAAQNQQLFTLKSYSSVPYPSLLSRDYYRSTAFKDDVAEYTQAIHSRGRKVKLQNQLAKQLAESKYSGAVANRKAKPRSEIEQDFKQNLQTQYGFDQKTAATMWKLYHNIKKKEGTNADYVFNRLVGGIVYDTTDKDKFMWANTAGVGGEAGHHDGMGILQQLKKEYGLTAAEYNKLVQKVRTQHVKSEGNRISDFAHQSITTATSLYKGGYLRSANVIAFENSYKNTTVPWYERVPRVLSKWFGAKGYIDELAGWRGDVTGEALKEPTMGNDDYKADLDSVNIVQLMKTRDMDYSAAVNQYYSDIQEGKYTRAKAFVENVGGKDKLLQELLDAELIESPTQKSALQELKEKNPVAYDFYNSLTVDDGKGSNDLIKKEAN